MGPTRKKIQESHGMFLGDRMTRTYGTKNTRAVLKQEMENCNRTENISQSAHLGSVPTL